MSETSNWTVAGMTCGHCVASVKEEVAEIAGVQAVEVDLATGALDITSETALDRTTVETAVREAGYALS